MACAAASVAVRSEAAGPFEAVRAEIEQSIRSGAAPSMVVAVARNGSVIWEEAFGFADRERKRAAKPGTPYVVGSVTKPLTATAVMMLHEKGAISIDRPINEYLGSVQLAARVGTVEEATVRRVLSHTAGLPTHYRFFFEDEKPRPPAIEDSIRCFGVLMTRPGEMHLYSNIGYGILGYLVGQVSRRGYADFMRDEVFRPLGMTRTTIADRRPPADAAVGYGRDGKPLPFYFTDHPGASAAFATAGDLARFGMFHAGVEGNGRSILTQDARRKMQQPGGAEEYGLGWSINPDWNGYRVIWHSGAAPGAGATLWIVPDYGIAIAVVSNIITAPSNRIAGRILEQLLVKRSAPAVAAPKQAATARMDESPPRGSWRGTMRTCEATEDLALELTDAGARARISGTEWINLERTQQDGAFLGGTIRHPDQRRSFRLYLRASGARWLGTVLMTESLGPRANNAVSYWTELNRIDEREPR